ncbi:MAG: GtrA family protein [Legionellales bacterium]
MTASLKLTHRLFYFVGVGGTAALVHVSIVLILVSGLGMQPLIANILAFLVSFNISFVGHKHLTFSQMHAQKKLKLPHFFVVCASAGVINESLYFLLLRYSKLNYIVALILVMGIVSTYSFIVSRLWACR